MEDEIDLLINMAGCWDVKGLFYIVWDMSEDMPEYKDAGKFYTFDLSFELNDSNLCPPVWSENFISSLIFT